ncbi:YceI family protein [Hymenobacter cellulosilyticus]|uniref:YceI family protein n=1 Tax=Hymenobacter cellulosilyticus TaxID=2932248 RepID=UPI0021D40AF8|nr:YceI family protein [Hymenobacter cellulosilyticus]
MKKFALSALFVASIMIAPAVAKDPSAPKAATSTKAAATVYKVQPQLSTLGWVGKKVTGQHSGTIQFKSGDVEVKGNQITGGTFVIDMNSLKVTDITDADTNGKLMGHLRSDDFFSIEKNATSTFKITKITPSKALPLMLTTLP